MLQGTKTKAVLGLCTILFVFGGVLWRFTPLDFTSHHLVSMLNLRNENSQPSMYPAKILDEPPCEDKAACRIEQLRDDIRQTCLNDKHIRRNRDQKRFYAYLSPKYKLLYFNIPKVGCSFWKRVLKTLNTNKTDMFETPNYKANAKDNDTFLVREKKAVYKLMGSYTSFVMVRDPFSRLFSGFVDRIFLPNFLWKRIIKKPDFAYIRSRSKVKNDSCAMSISFQKFIDYVTTMTLNNEPIEFHFQPMRLFLNPCDTNVTHVFKMENFMEDLHYLFSSRNVTLEDIAPAENDHKFEELHEKGYLKDLIYRTYEFHLIYDCMPWKKLLQRLWKVFLIRGYLSKFQKMPEFTDPNQVTVDEFVDAAWAAFDVRGPKAERALQRHEAMLEAFAQLPRNVLKKLSKALDGDCRLFRYNCNVDQRFPVEQLKSIRPFYFTD